MSQACHREFGSADQQNPRLSSVALAKDDGDPSSWIASSLRFSQ